MCKCSEIASRIFVFEFLAQKIDNPERKVVKHDCFSVLP